jgi:hypothetical protein
MDALGIAGIHQRIAQVEARFVMPASVAPVRAVAGATAVGEKSFAGVDIGVTDSYRSYDAQVDVARRKGLYSQGGLAATPGTSDHGWA